MIDESRIKDALKDLAGEPNAQVEARVSKAVMLAGASIHQRRRVLPVAAALVAAAAVVAATATAIGTSGAGRSQTHQPSSASRAIDSQPGTEGLPSAALGQPCPGARLFDDDPEAMVAENKPMWLSDGPEKVTRAWLCKSVPFVVYDNDLVVYYATSQGDPADKEWGTLDYFSKWAKAMGEGAYATTIDGYAAIVRPAADDGRKNQVMIAVGNTTVRIVAEPKIPLESLISLANHLSLPER